MKYYQLTGKIIIILALLLAGCNKILDVKSNNKLSVPVTLDDFQAILDHAANMNTDFISIGLVSADEYYLTDADYNAMLYESDKRLYTWQPDYVSRLIASVGDEWYNTYKGIYACNAVIDGLQQNQHTGIIARNIKGQALTFRAARYLDGVLAWAPIYNKATARNDLGMVIREDPDFNKPSKRYSVEETYEYILNDLHQAIDLLPPTQISRSRPDKSAAYGLLARTYLYMGQYDSALTYAEKVIQFSKELIDFNNLNSSSNYPLPAVNGIGTETIFYNVMFYANPLSGSVAKITPELYNLYPTDDLRKLMFFRTNPDNSIRFKGSLSGGSGNLTGISVGEIYLILTECNIRLNKLAQASEYINTLLVKRWKKTKYVPYQFTNATTALEILFKERRKELVFRGTRWADLKRLNRDGAAITLQRTVNGQVYKLPPNDLRYAVAIPEDVILLSGIPQNPR
ncbi:RagB/SusD family nutrient uptake outer membrane protein [Polluticaenibacter yanchengensis]|uniref:RagB/SusD family nutrient uptake outer membrane protein n=1 Tax=Polluticaenibacter yanchengensis TaxID=3014562 RepID=A0ABT4UFJ3_9BACT|nr:RagB/SusD family nutrient uptake outer membrane protein [Chitinophagaceae bacterium LY-5]